jgi:hypothetical protein
MPKFQETEEAVKALMAVLMPLNKALNDIAQNIVSVDGVIKKQAKTTEDLTEKEKELKRQTELNTQVEKLAQKAKELSTEAGKKLTLEQVKLADARKKAVTAAKAEANITQQHTGFMNKLTGAVRGGITQFALIAGAIGGSIAVLKKFGTSIVNSSDVLQDKWAIAMAGAKAASDAFFTSIGKGDFSNLLSNMDKAISAAIEYEELMDKLEDRSRALGIAESKFNVVKQAQLKILRDVGKSNKERIAAADFIIKKENELANTTTDIAEKALKGKLKEYADSKDITKKIIEDNLLNYESNSDLIDQADVYNKALEEKAAIEKLINQGQDMSQSKVYAKILNDVANADEKVVAFSKMRAKYTDLNKEKLDELAQLYKTYYNALASADEKTQRTNARRNSLIDENIKIKEKANKEEIISNEKVRDEFLKNFQDSINKATEIKRKWDLDSYKADLEFADLQKDIEDQMNDYSEQAHKDLLEAEAEETQKGLDADVQAFQDAQDKKQKIIEDFQFAINAVGDLEGLLSQKKLQDIDTEMNKLNFKRDAEIAAAEKAGKDTAKIKEKYQKQENKLKEKQWKTEHKHAIVQSIINTALAVTASLANPIQAIAVGILGAIETGIIASQEMPKYKHGGTAKKGTFAQVSEQGSELAITKSGMFLTPERESKVFFPEETKIFPAYSPETKKAKELISKDGTVTELKEIKKLLSRPQVISGVDRDGVYTLIKEERTRTRVRGLIH